MYEDAAKETISSSGNRSNTPRQGNKPVPLGSM